MAKPAQRGFGGLPSSSDPALTKQYAGHLRHQEHLAAQEQDRQARRKARLKNKEKNKA